MGRRMRKRGKAFGLISGEDTSREGAVFWLATSNCKLAIHTVDRKIAWILKLQLNEESSLCAENRNFTMSAKSSGGPNGKFCLRTDT